jgi:uncharacterized membrane protein
MIQRAAATVCTILLALGLVLRLAAVPVGGAVLAAGLILLVSIPVGRLIGVLVVLVRERQWRFVIVALAVVVLLASTVIWPAR